MDMSLHTRNAIPDWAVAVMGLVVASAVLAVGIYRATGHGPVSPATLAAIQDQVQLTFTDQPDGSIDVYDAETGQLLSTLAYGTNGFIRSTMRGLARARKQIGEGAATPFRLARHGDGHLTLKDPVTRRMVHLRAFGATNEAAFGALLNARNRLADDALGLPEPSGGTDESSPRMAGTMDRRLDDGQ